MVLPTNSSGRLRPVTRTNSELANSQRSALPKSTPIAEGACMKRSLTAIWGLWLSSTKNFTLRELDTWEDFPLITERSAWLLRKVLLNSDEFQGPKSERLLAQIAPYHIEIRLLAFGWVARRACRKRYESDKH